MFELALALAGTCSDAPGLAGLLEVEATMLAALWARVNSGRPVVDVETPEVVLWSSLAASMGVLLFCNESKERLLEIGH